MIRGFRFDLHPTAEQAEILGQWVGVARLTYNLALEQRRDFWRQYQATEGRQIGIASQGRELTELRRQFDFIAAAPQTILEAAINDLDRAYSTFFKGVAKYPTPRRLGLNDTMRLRGREVAVRILNRKWAELKLPKLRHLRFRMTRALPEAIKTVTLTRSGAGWTVAFACDVGEPASATDLPSLGIDRGVANTLSLSSGEQLALPAGARLSQRVRKSQRILARRKRGSRRYAKQRARVAAIREKAVRIRKHWAHETTTSIARRFGVVSLEELNICAMTASAVGNRETPGKGVRQKAGLNRSIMEQSWGQIGFMLEYKLEAAGGRLVYVPAAYTSQTCSACGVVDRASRKSQATFACVHCGHEAHADTNAALEIQRRSTALLLAEAGRLGLAAEPRTLAA